MADRISIACLGKRLLVLSRHCCDQCCLASLRYRLLWDGGFLEQLGLTAYVYQDNPWIAGPPLSSRISRCGKMEVAKTVRLGGSLAKIVYR